MSKSFISVSNAFKDIHKTDDLQDSMSVTVNKKSNTFNSDHCIPTHAPHTTCSVIKNGVQKIVPSKTIINRSPPKQYLHKPEQSRNFKSKFRLVSDTSLDVAFYETSPFYVFNSYESSIPKEARYFNTSAIYPKIGLATNQWVPLHENRLTGNLSQNQNSSHRTNIEPKSKQDEKGGSDGTIHVFRDYSMRKICEDYSDLHTFYRPVYGKVGIDKHPSFTRHTWWTPTYKPPRLHQSKHYNVGLYRWHDYSRTGALPNNKLSLSYSNILTRDRYQRFTYYPKQHFSGTSWHTHPFKPLDQNFSHRHVDRKNPKSSTADNSGSRDRADHPSNTLLTSSSVSTHNSCLHLSGKSKQAGNYSNLTDSLKEAQKECVFHDAQPTLSDSRTLTCSDCTQSNTHCIEESNAQSNRWSSHQIYSDRKPLSRSQSGWRASIEDQTQNHNQRLSDTRRNENESDSSTIMTEWYKWGPKYKSPTTFIQTRQTFGSTRSSDWSLLTYSSEKSSSNTSDIQIKKLPSTTVEDYYIHRLLSVQNKAKTCETPSINTDITEISTKRTEATTDKLEVAKIKEAKTDRPETRTDRPHMTEKSPTRTEAKTDRSRMTEKSPKRTEARTDRSRMTETSPKRTETRTDRPHMTEKSPTRTEAKTDRSRMTEKSPKRTEARTDRSRMTEKSPNRIEARTDRSRMTEKSPKRTEARTDRSRMTEKSPNRIEARTDRSRMTEKSPKRTEARTDRSRTTEKSPNRTEARTDRPHMTEKSPTKTEAKTDRSRLTEKSPTRTEARTDRSRMTEISPTRTEARTDRSRMTEKSPKRTKARTDRSRMTEKSPNRTEARTHRSCMTEKSSKNVKAEVDYSWSNAAFSSQGKEKKFNGVKKTEERKLCEMTRLGCKRMSEIKPTQQTSETYSRTNYMCKKNDNTKGFVENRWTRGDGERKSKTNKDCSDGRKFVYDSDCTVTVLHKYKYVNGANPRSVRTIKIVPNRKEGDAIKVDSDWSTIERACKDDKNKQTQKNPETRKSKREGETGTLFKQPRESKFQTCLERTEVKQAKRKEDIQHKEMSMEPKLKLSGRCRAVTEYSPCKKCVPQQKKRTTKAYCSSPLDKSRKGSATQPKIGIQERRKWELNERLKDRQSKGTPAHEEKFQSRNQNVEKKGSPGTSAITGKNETSPKGNISRGKEHQQRGRMSGKKEHQSKRTRDEAQSLSPPDTFKNRGSIKKTEVPTMEEPPPKRKSSKEVGTHQDKNTLKKDRSPERENRKLYENPHNNKNMKQTEKEKFQEHKTNKSPISPSGKGDVKRNGEKAGRSVSSGDSFESKTEKGDGYTKRNNEKAQTSESSRNSFESKARKEEGGTKRNNGRAQRSESFRNSFESQTEKEDGDTKRNKGRAQRSDSIGSSFESKTNKEDGGTTRNNGRAQRSESSRNSFESQTENEDGDTKRNKGRAQRSESSRNSIESKAEKEDGDKTQRERVKRSVSAGESLESEIENGKNENNDTQTREGKQNSPGKMLSIKGHQDKYNQETGTKQAGSFLASLCDSAICLKALQFFRNTGMRYFAQSLLQQMETINEKNRTMKFHTPQRRGLFAPRHLYPVWIYPNDALGLYKYITKVCGLKTSGRNENFNDRQQHRSFLPHSCKLPSNSRSQRCTSRDSPTSFYSTQTYCRDCISRQYFFDKMSCHSSPTVKSRSKHWNPSWAEKLPNCREFGGYELPLSHAGCHMGFHWWRQYQGLKRTFHSRPLQLGRNIFFCRRYPSRYACIPYGVEQHEQREIPEDYQSQSRKPYSYKNRNKGHRQSGGEALVKVKSTRYEDSTCRECKSPSRARNTHARENSRKLQFYTNELDEPKCGSKIKIITPKQVTPLCDTRQNHSASSTFSGLCCKNDQNSTGSVFHLYKKKLPGKKYFAKPKLDYNKCDPTLTRDICAYEEVVPTIDPMQFQLEAMASEASDDLASSFCYNPMPCSQKPSISLVHSVDSSKEAQERSAYHTGGTLTGIRDNISPIKDPCICTPVNQPFKPQKYTPDYIKPLDKHSMVAFKDTKCGLVSDQDISYSLQEFPTDKDLSTSVDPDALDETFLWTQRYPVRERSSRVDPVRKDASSKKVAVSATRRIRRRRQKSLTNSSKSKHTPGKLSKKFNGKGHKSSPKTGQLSASTFHGSPTFDDLSKVRLIAASSSANRGRGLLSARASKTASRVTNTSKSQVSHRSSQIICPSPARGVSAVGVMKHSPNRYRETRRYRKSSASSHSSATKTVARKRLEKEFPHSTLKAQEVENFTPTESFNTIMFHPRKSRRYSKKYKGSVYEKSTEGIKKELGTYKHYFKPEEKKAASKKENASKLLTRLEHIFRKTLNWMPTFSVDIPKLDKTAVDNERYTTTSVDNDMKTSKIQQYISGIGTYYIDPLHSTPVSPSISCTIRSSPHHSPLRSDTNSFIKTKLGRKRRPSSGSAVAKSKRTLGRHTQRRSHSFKASKAKRQTQRSKAKRQTQSSKRLSHSDATNPELSSNEREGTPQSIPEAPLDLSSVGMLSSKQYIESSVSNLMSSHHQLEGKSTSLDQNSLSSALEANNQRKSSYVSTKSPRSESRNVAAVDPGRKVPAILITSESPAHSTLRDLSPKQSTLPSQSKSVYSDKKYRKYKSSSVTESSNRSTVKTELMFFSNYIEDRDPMAPTDATPRGTRRLSELKARSKSATLESLPRYSTHEHPRPDEGSHSMSIYRGPASVSPTPKRTKYSTFPHPEIFSPVHMCPSKSSRPQSMRWYYKPYCDLDKRCFETESSYKRRFRCPRFRSGLCPRQHFMLTYMGSGDNAC